jgi:hypothetical protein
VLWGYFDESGKFADSDFVCLCGFLSGDTWDGFCREWKEQLIRYGFPSIHMSKMDWRDKQKAESLKDFVKVIRQHLILGFAVTVDAKYYRAMPVPKQKLLGEKDPRDFTFHQLLRLIRDDLHERGMDDWLALHFDYEEGFSVECLQSLIKLRSRHDFIKKLVRSIGFADDEMFYPLQAADLFAYGHKRSLQGNAPDYWNEFIQPASADNLGPRIKVAGFDSAHLEDMCEQMKKARASQESGDTLTINEPPSEKKSPLAERLPSKGC